MIVAGRAADSEMIRRIWLPPSHKDAMPPGGKHPVTVSEAAVLRWWIDQGAPGDKKLGELGDHRGGRASHRGGSSASSRVAGPRCPT